MTRSSEEKLADTSHTETGGELECNCLVPWLEGAGNHSPGCSIFTPEERKKNIEEIRRRTYENL